MSRHFLNDQQKVKPPIQRCLTMERKIKESGRSWHLFLAKQFKVEFQFHTKGKLYHLAMSKTKTLKANKMAKLALNLLAHQKTSTSRGKSNKC